MGAHHTGVACTICSDLASLCREIAAGAGAALLTVEAIHQDQAGVLIQTLQDEPSWSNFPLIVLIHQPEATQRALAHSPLLMTLVERPVRIAALRSVVQAALQHRRHQYRNRDMLANLANQAEELRHSEERLRHIAQNLSEAKSQLEAANQELEARVHAAHGETSRKRCGT